MKTKVVLLLLVSLSIVMTVGVFGVASQDSVSETGDEGVRGLSSVEAAVGSGFTYQGRLQDNDVDANGQYDFQFTLYDAMIGGVQFGGTVTKANVEVKDGLFTTYLDFGGHAFNLEGRYLEIWVRPGSSTSTYEKLSGRQVITAVPLALNVHNPNASLFASSLHTTAGVTVLNPNNTEASVRLDFANDIPRIRVAGNGSGASSGFAIEGQGDGRMLYVSEAGELTANDMRTRTMIVNEISTNEIFTNDKIGIGTSPAAALDIKANSTTVDGWYEAIRFSQGAHSAITHPAGGLLFGMHGINRTFYFGDSENGTLQKYLMTINANNGRVAIGTVNPQAKLHVAGDTILAGTTQTNILQINGGADIAEGFDINGSDTVEPEPGMVVCIDPENPGELVVCDQAYDFTVAGAVSGAGGVKPGMVMGQEGSIAAGESPVALTGRVYVQVDASSGAVQPGDLLTTSNTPGHAMKVTDSDQAQGAILGKAMTSLDSGTGLVLVLVTLQ